MKRTMRNASRGYVPTRDEIRATRTATRARALMVARVETRDYRDEIRDYFAGGAA